MRVNIWLWALGAGLLLIAGTYTWQIYNRASTELWSWGHELVATFVSVGFALVIGLALVRKASADRKRELRASIVAVLFDHRDMVDDKNLQTVRLPDGSEENVLITFLQSMVFEEAIRSGLFDGSETISLSRLSAIVNVYNGAVSNLLPVLRSVEYLEAGEVDSKRIEELRDAIHEVQDKRQTVVDAGENLMKVWTLDELTDALDMADTKRRENADPRVAYLLEQNRPQISPAGYKAGIVAKIDKVREAHEAGNIETACNLLNEAIEEAQALSGAKISEDDAGHLITEIEGLKKTLRC